MKAAIKPLIRGPAWKALAAHYKQMRDRHLRDLFAADVQHGERLALYEHNVCTQGVIWGINSFDQWGVELGKALAQAIIPQLESSRTPPLEHGSSTNNL